VDADASRVVVGEEPDVPALQDATERAPHPLFQQSGQTLSEAFAKHPKCFDRLYVNMVKAGEAGGALETIMQRLADFKERAQSLKRRITGAMVYPIAVITVAVGILTFIMVYIIPKFEKIFKDFNMTLPDMTLALMATSRWFSQYWYVLPLFPLCFWLLIKLIRLSRTGNYAVDRVYLWIPVIGPLIEKTVVARTMRTLGTLVSSGVPILEALSESVESLSSRAENLPASVENLL
jgi:type IV pilus assembly protein PilC